MPIILLMRLQFVAHPNCQQHLTSIWYGPEMGFLQSLTLWKKVVMWFVCMPLVPIFCLIYIVTPHSKVAVCFLSHRSFFNLFSQNTVNCSVVKKQLSS